MTTFNEAQLGTERLPLFKGKYGRHQAMSLFSRLSVYFVDCSRGQMVFELQGGGKLWRMFTGVEMLKIRNDDRFDIRKKRTVIAVDA